MSTWTEHVTAALLGTRRRPVPPLAEAGSTAAAPRAAGDPRPTVRAPHIGDAPLSAPPPAGGPARAGDPGPAGEPELAADPPAPAAPRSPAPAPHTAGPPHTSTPPGVDPPATTPLRPAAPAPPTAGPPHTGAGASPVVSGGPPDEAAPLAAGSPSAGGPAGRLLDQAALLTVRRRAGRLPETAEPVAPAPAEATRPVPAAAARRLRRILAGEHARLLPEWLDAAARAGRHVPPSLLPELLDRGRADRALRPHLARAAGRRGVWLAMRNVDWAYLVVTGGDEAAADPALWQTGVRAQRVGHLTRLRAADPAAARATLSQTWAREPAADRAAFLATFERGLSRADEEFLEAALDDRGVDVRRVAADLLARLPASAYAARMAARGRSCLGPADAGDRRRIVVQPPREHDDAMLRDGIPFHAAAGIGNRAGWLREILGRAPLSTWTELFDAGPEVLVRLPVVAHRDAARGTAGVSAAGVPSPDPPGSATAAGPAGRPAAVPAGPASDPHTTEDVHQGWADAAVRQRDPAWARALLGPRAAAGDTRTLAGLLDALPDDERDRAAAAAIRPIRGRAALLGVLQRLPGPWRGELADAAIGVLASVAARDEPGRALIREMSAEPGTASAFGAGGAASPARTARIGAAGPPGPAGAAGATGAAGGGAEAARDRVLALLCGPTGEHLTADAAPRLADLARRHPDAPALTELAETLHFRHQMHDELR